jgi:hypothetical protein
MPTTLKCAALAGAAMSLMCQDDIKSSNKWRKRYLSMVPGIDFPDDFDSLPDEEQKQRLDAAMKVGLESGGGE